MSKIIRLTESDLERIVKRVLVEENDKCVSPGDPEYVAKSYESFTKYLGFTCVEAKPEYIRIEKKLKCGAILAFFLKKKRNQIDFYFKHPKYYQEGSIKIPWTESEIQSLEKQLCAKIPGNQPINSVFTPEEIKNLKSKGFAFGQKKDLAMRKLENGLIKITKFYQSPTDKYGGYHIKTKVNGTDIADYKGLHDACDVWLDNHLKYLEKKNYL